MVDDSDWLYHDGSEMPKHADPCDLVHVKFRDGAVSDSSRTAGWWGPSSAGDPGNWTWDNDLVGSEYQIVAYRVVK